MAGNPVAFLPAGFNNDAFQTGGVVPPVVETPTGGWKNVRDFLSRQVSKDEVRKRREELGIVPKQAKRIEKIADKLASEVEVYEPNRLLVQIKASEDYQNILNVLAKRNEARRMEIAEFVAAQILHRIVLMQEAEDRAIITLLMEM
jgi:hypothetical protein